MIRSAYLSRLLAPMAITAALALPAGLAFAAASEGDYVGTTAAEITESLVQQGYEVDEIVIEILFTMDGKPYEIVTDPRTGEIVEIEEEKEEGSSIKRLLRIGGND